MGLWATVHDRSYIGDRPENHNQFRAINQINVFNARTSTVNGARWLPYMPLGNNGNFLVDASHFP